MGEATGRGHNRKELGQAQKWSQAVFLRSCPLTGWQAAKQRSQNQSFLFQTVLRRADCLPMFSVLGARMLIEEVHANSKAAAVVGTVLRRARLARRRVGACGGSSTGSSSGCSSPSSAAGGLARTASNASSAGSSLGCEAACCSGGCRGLCCCPADSASELAEVDTPPAGLGGSSGLGRSRLQRISSAWSTASTASIAAFASDAAGSDRGSALVPMFPPGRILWLLPQKAGAQERAGGRELPPQLVETSQAAFERFLITLETTAAVHLPDFYIRAIDAVAAEQQR